MMTVKDMLKYGEDSLKEVGVSEYAYDSRALLQFVLKCDMTYLIININEAIEDKVVDIYKGLLKKRCERYPLQYIIGETGFMSYTFKVNENVLIPRQDTECLVEEVVKLINIEDNVLDLCTGSGCIGISLFNIFRDGLLNCHKGNIDVTLSDISAKAIDLAKYNANLNNAKVSFVVGDLFEKLDSRKKYNVIISNPPYIPTKVIEGLENEVKTYEPYNALWGHDDGLYFYKRIINEARDYLHDCGYIAFEIGYDQALEIAALLKQANYDSISVKKDLAGLDRVIIGRFIG